MEKIIYFVRHGETIGNKARIHQGSDERLSDRGLDQAKNICDFLKECSIETILSSPFARARETAEIIAERLDLEVEFSNLFVEIKRPSVVIGKSMHDPAIMEIKKQVKDHFGEKGYRHSDEETYQDMVDRSKAALHEITLQKADKILIVTHGQFMRAMVWTMMFGNSMTPDLYRQVLPFFELGNTGVTICKITDGETYKLVSWNSNATLGNGK